MDIGVVDDRGLFGDEDEGFLEEIQFTSHGLHISLDAMLVISAIIGKRREPA